MVLQVGSSIIINPNERDEHALVLCIKKELLVIMLKSHFIVIFNWSVIDDRIVWEYGKQFVDFMEMSEYVVEKLNHIKHLDSVFSSQN